MNQRELLRTCRIGGSVVALQVRQADLRGPGSFRSSIPAEGDAGKHYELQEIIGNLSFLTVVLTIPSSQLKAAITPKNPRRQKVAGQLIPRGFLLESQENGSAFRHFLPSG